MEVRCGICHSRGRLEAVIAEASEHPTITGGCEPTHPATTTTIITATETLTPPFVFVPGNGVLNRLEQ